MNRKIRVLTFTAILIALSTVLSYVPIPGYPTLSFDSTPGFFAAIFIHPVLGGMVALIGHLITSLIHGFPMGLPAHLIIAGTMFVAAYLFGILFKRNSVILKGVAFVVAIVANTYLSMPLLIQLIGVPSEVLYAIQIPLLIASAVNLAAATFIFATFKSAKFSL